MQKLFFLCFFVIFASCNSSKTEVNTNLPDNQYLVFGKFFGHCRGECATLYKMDNNQLFADELERFSGWNELKFKTTPLSNEAYQTAKTLLESFPQELLNVREETIGCPDCADQGGFAIEIRRNGETRRWRIDTNRADLPDYLKMYVDKLDSVLTRLEN